MKSCNRVIISVLMLLGACGAEAPDPTTAAVQNVGLQTATTPPLGEGVPPGLGFPGDGSAVVTGAGTSVGGATGPAAVRWHGGQWLVPYRGSPGSVVQNVSCDVVPSATATDLIELVASNGQVLGSSTVPAATGTMIRSWIVLSPGFVIPDGGQIVMRHSPMRASGAWTGPSDDITVIGCAVNMVHPKTIPIAINGPRVGASPGFQGDALYMSGPVQTAIFQIQGVPVGSMLTGARVRVRDSAVGPTRLNAIIYPSTDGTQGPPIATSETSTGSGLAQTLSISGVTTPIAPLTTYSIYVNMTTGSAQVSVVGIDVDYRP